jgi:CBS domain-containing protein
MDRDDKDLRTVREAGTEDPVVAYPDEVLRESIIKMLRNDIGRLPVVAREDPTKLVGYVDRSQLMKARMRWYEEEHLREGRWRIASPTESHR